MKRAIAWFLVLILMIGLSGGALAEADAVKADVTYAGETFDVYLAGFSFEEGEPGQVTLTTDGGPSLSRVLLDGQDVGMQLDPGVEMELEGGDSPFFCAVAVVLESGGKYVEPIKATATRDDVTFTFDPVDAPDALLVYPYDGSLVDARRIVLSAVAPKSAGDGVSFVLNGVEYTVIELQDVPSVQRENRLDGLEGHVIRFGYASSAASEEANSQLYENTKLLTPEGTEVRTYSNDGNIENPYTLFFGLPDGVMLADCTMRVPTDDGEQLYPLAAVMGNEAEPSQPDEEPVEEAPEEEGEAPPVEQSAPEEDIEPEATKVPEATPIPEATPASEAAPDGDQVDQVLADLAAETEDPWQKAIYEAGSDGYTVDGDVAILSLRSFDPKLKELPDYEKDAAAWIDGLIDHIGRYDLEVEVEVDGGAPTEAGIQAIKGKVEAAAKAARSAFDKKVVRVAIAEYLLPLPVDSLKSDDDLNELSESFEGIMETLGLDGYDARYYAPLYYAQSGQTLNVDGGPHALVLNCKGPDSAEFLEATRAQAMDHLSKVYGANNMEDYQIKEIFLNQLIAAANVAREKKSGEYALTLDIDGVFAGEPGQDYLDYVEAYSYLDVQSEIISAASKLPDAPAQDFPKSGRISGSTGGTKVTIKAPDDGRGRYVQMRVSDTDEAEVDLFIRPGGSATVHVPKGFYYLLIASGETWYGVEGLFGDTGYYSSTSETEILSSKYYHTIELQTAEEGNMSTYGASMSDFY